MDAEYAYLAPDSAEVVEQPAVTEPQDIDIHAWLGQQSAQATDYVEFDDGRVKIAAVSEVEENRLMKAARRVDPKNPGQTKVDVLLYRRLYVAFSLGKASGTTIDPDKLNGMLPGKLTRLQREIQRLSAYEVQPQAQIDPFASFD